MPLTALQRVLAYQARHPERVKEQRKRYKQKSAERICEYQKEYYDRHYKKNRKEKIQCECGTVVSKRHLPAHQRTTLHNNRLQTHYSCRVFSDYKIIEKEDCIELLW